MALKKKLKKAVKESKKAVKKLEAPVMKCREDVVVVDNTAELIHEEKPKKG